jgi:cobalt/nickel transport system permease protein
VHIPDGFVNLYVCFAMFVVAALFLIWAWKGARSSLRGIYVPLIAISSAILLLVQFIEFPAAGGASTWHIMGGTIIAMILGPHATIISMTITLIIQALLGDGGISTFGINVINMAVIGGLSFYLVKIFNGKSLSKKRLGASVFAAAWMSNTLTGLIAGLEIGAAPLVGSVGGLAVTVPTMLILYVPTGLIEGVVGSVLIVALSRINGVKLFGLELIYAKLKSGKDRNIVSKIN